MEGTIGEIRLFAGNFAPEGWLLCQGQVLSIEQYTAVFSILETTYGGDGQTTFALPDLQGRVPVHAANSHGGFSAVALGEVGGYETVTLVSSQMPAHKHGATMKADTSTIKFTVSDQNSTLDTPESGLSALGTRGVVSPDGSFQASPTYNNKNGAVALNAGTLSPVSVTNSVTGSSMPHENMAPFQVLNYIICVMGIFPSRP